MSDIQTLKASQFEKSGKYARLKFPESACLLETFSCWIDELYYVYLELPKHFYRYLNVFSVERNEWTITVWSRQARVPGKISSPVNLTGDEVFSRNNKEIFELLHFVPKLKRLNCAWIKNIILFILHSYVYNKLCKLRWEWFRTYNTEKYFFANLTFFEPRCSQSSAIIFHNNLTWKLIVLASRFRITLCSRRINLRGVSCVPRKRSRRLRPPSRYNLYESAMIFVRAPVRRN